MKNQLPQPDSFQHTYNINNIFSLFISQNTNSAKIKMMITDNPINTIDIPSTYIILKKFLPTVLTTQCFNDQNLPFNKEVINTEIGHLFEHILLEYMCQLKIAKGYKSAVYTGRTHWNWKRDPKGLFHIYISCSQKDADIFPVALQKTILLIKIILKSKKKLKTTNNPLLPKSLRTHNGLYLDLPTVTRRNFSELAANEGLKNGLKFNRRAKPQTP